MEKIEKNKICLQVLKRDDAIVVSTLLPTSLFVDSDVAAILSYLASRYDVLYFCASVCDPGLDRSLVFRLKGCFFDAERFSQFLFSL